MFSGPQSPSITMAFTSRTPHVLRLRISSISASVYPASLQHLAAVLAKPRRVAVNRQRLPVEAKRCVGHFHGAFGWMLMGAEKPGCLKLLVGSEILKAVDRPAGNLRCAQQLKPFRCGPLPSNPPAIA